MYSTTATHRSDINAVVEQAQAADKNLLAQKILPVKSVKSRAGEYPIIELASGKLMRHETTKRNASGTYNEITRAHGWDDYRCIDRGLEERVDDAKAKEMGSYFSLEKMTAKQLRRHVSLDFEVSAAGIIMNAANFSVTTKKVAYTEALIDTMDVPHDVEEAKLEVLSRGEECNTMVLSALMWNRIRRSKQMQAYVWGKISDSTGKKQLTAKMLEEAFEIETVHIAKGHHDTGKGKTVDVSAIWGNDHIWLGNVQGGDFDNGGVGRTLVWDAMSPGGLFSTETYRDNKRKSDMCRVTSNSIEKLVNKNAGQLISTGWV